MFWGSGFGLTAGEEVGSGSAYCVFDDLWMDYG